MKRFGLAVAACLAPCLAGAVSCGTYASQWPMTGNPAWGAMSPSGQLYMVRGASFDIQVYNKAGVYQYTAVSTGFFNPAGIAFNAAGEYYVADSNNNQVKKFSAANALLSTWGGFGTGNGQFNQSEMLAIEPSSGDVFASDRNNHRVQRFTSGGAFVSAFGSSGTGNGQFNQPRGMAIYGGKIYVADSQNNRIEVFSLAGAYLSQWGSAGTGNGQFNHPFDVKADASGDIYVSDENNNRVQIFDSSGAYLSQWGSLGSGNGQFTYVYTVILDEAAGTAYVCDYGGGSNRVEMFNCASALASPTPTYSTTASPTASPTASATASPTNSPTLYVTASGTPSATPSPVSSQTPVPSSPSPTPAVTAAANEAREFPNPVPAGAQFAHFALRMEAAGTATITVWNSAAQVVATVEERFAAGQRQVKLTVKDFAPGIYLYQLSLLYDSGSQSVGPVQRFAIRP